MASEINIKLNVISKDALSSLKKFSNNAQKTLKKALGNGADSAKELKRGINAAADEYKRLNEQNENFNNTARNVAATASVAFAGFAAAIGGAVSQAAKFERIGVEFRVLTGSVESANQALDQLRAFTARTPFQFEDVANAGRTLLAFGFEVNSIEQRLQSLGDVAAVSGKPIGELAVIFGQVAGAGKLTGERLNQLQEAGVNVVPAIANELGVLETQVRSLVSKGVVDFKTFENAFNSLSQEGGIAFGGLDKLSATLGGRLSTLSDAFVDLVAEVGNQFLPTLKSAAAFLTDFLQQIRNNPAFVTFTASVLGIGAALSGLVATGALAAIAFNQITTAVASLRVGLAALQIPLAKVLIGLLPIVAAIAAFVAAGFALFKALQFIERETGVLSDIFEVLSDVVGRLFSDIFGLTDVFDGFGDAIIKVGTFISKILVFSLTSLIEGFLQLLQLNPFGIFEEKEVAKLQNAQKRLSEFNKELISSAVEFREFQSQGAKAVNEVNEGLKQNGFREFAEDAARSIAGVNQSTEDINISPLIELRKELQDVGVTELGKLTRQRDERLKVIEEGLKAEGEALKLAKELEEKILLDFNQKASVINKKRSEENIRFFQEFERQATQIQNQIQGVFENASVVGGLQNFFGSPTDQQRAIDGLQKQLDENLSISPSLREIKQDEIDDLKEQLSRSSAIGIAAGFGNAIAGGAQGAQDLITDLFSFGAEALLPGLGRAISPLIELFAQGPEQVKKTVQAFVDNLPIVIENIVASIPVFIEALADNADVIVERLAEKAPDIIRALIRALPSASLAFAQALAIDVPFALIKEIPRIVGTFAEAIGEAFLDSFTAVFDALNPVSLLSKIFGFDGGGRGPVEKFLGFDFPFIAFNQGGIVPGQSVFQGDSKRNDRVPAMLSPGELVIPRTAMGEGFFGIASFLQKLGVPVDIPGMFLGGFFRDVGGFITRTVDKFKSFVADPINFITDFAKNPLGLASEVLTFANISGSSLFGDILDTIGETTGIDFAFVLDTLRAQQFLQEIIASLLKVGITLNPLDLVADPKNAIGNAIKGSKELFQDPFRQLLSAPGLQNGGVIPSGFANDTFPARLSSGELVVPRDLTQRLEASIEREESGVSTDANTSLLNKILNELKKPQMVATKVQIDGTNLADVILELNRNNERLA